MSVVTPSGTVKEIVAPSAEEAVRVIALEVAANATGEKR